MSRLYDVIKETTNVTSISDQTFQNTSSYSNRMFRIARSSGNFYESNNPPTLFDFSLKQGETAPHSKLCVVPVYIDPKPNRTLNFYKRGNSLRNLAAIWSFVYITRFILHWLCLLPVRQGCLEEMQIASKCTVVTP